MPIKLKDIKERLPNCSYCFYDFGYTIDEIIGSLSALQEEFEAKGYKDIVIEYGYDGDMQFIGTRKETEYEANKRIEKDKKHKQSIKDKKEKRKQELIKEAKQYGLKLHE